MSKLDYELQLQSQGYKLLAGVDEVGRGPLAGPVVVACVILPLDDVIDGVDDSKKLSEKKRNFLYAKILEKAIAYKVVFVDEKTIDQINILNATKLAMKQAIEEMPTKPDCVLIDAVKLDCSVNTFPLIKGDALSYLIGAASIVAKVERDAYMTRLAEQYPIYGFDKNKGYGTKQHIDAIKSVGPCPIHRRSFIKNFLK